MAKAAKSEAAAGGRGRKAPVTGTENLTDTAIRKATKPGLYADGGKLYLRVASAKSKSWVLLYRFNGKPVEMGLGSLADVSLQEARRRRKHWLGVLAAGESPKEVREREEAARRAKEGGGKPMTFKDCAAEVIKVRGPRGAQNRAAWLRMMQVQVGALANMLPADITTEDVLKALKPWWHKTPVNADYMRNRIETILDWAHVKKLIPDPWSNPARFRGHLEWLLERREGERGHHPSLSYKKTGEFMAKLRGDAEVSEIVRLGVELCILTATRQGEARGARLCEFDREAKVWAIPAARMKCRKEHRVPLSDAAMAVVNRAWGIAEAMGSSVLFPSTYGTRSGSISQDTMNRVVLRYTGEREATIHGFRATFKDWSLNVGGYSDAIGEECLAHTVGNKVRNAYRRDDNLEGRRPVMEAWAAFLAKEWEEKRDNDNAPASPAAANSGGETAAA